ncbi:MAG: Holliday junction branch migration protein RuvA [Acutalibacteraceae bacterium]|nr:Holliday junction branch migration protein RuvA [Acutalibacteraceae bacterium]
MFYSLKGKLIYSNQSFVVIECGGVGYRCYTSQTTQSQLPSLNSETMLYTYLLVREDAMEIYGFFTEKELECFKLLISVSGVGAKMAIAILSVLNVERFVLAIASSDIASISQAQGVGKKKAERIILDLKDKIKVFDEVLPSGGLSGNTSVAVSAGNIPKAVEALSVLGYTSSEVSPILSQMDGSLPVEKLISGVLKEMGKR